MKIDKQFKGHLKYNPLHNEEEIKRSEKYMKYSNNSKKYSLYNSLLKKEKNLKLKNKSQNMKISIKNTTMIKADKYFSAPVSTKENGLVTKFKFKDVKNNTGKLKIKKSKNKQKESQRENEDLEENLHESSLKEEEKSHKESKCKNDEDELNPDDIIMPKNEEIERIFSNTVNSPIDKVIHMSVINSFDNFEEEKKARDQKNKDTEIEIQRKGSNSDQSNKAAVPILDLNKIFHKKKMNREAVKEYEDPFDQDSHLDLSSKRIKKLILTSDFSSLIHLREEVINSKVVKEKDKIKLLLNSDKISPRTGKERSLKLEKWVIKEKDEINQTKNLLNNLNKTENIINETQVNGDVLKQIINIKVTTPRESVSVRSGLNSERKRYEQQQKLINSEQEKSSSQSRERSQNNDSHSGVHENIEMVNQLGRKETDLTQKKGKEENKSETDDMISVDTPVVFSDGQNSSSNNAENTILIPKNLEESSFHDSNEAIIQSNKPISFEI